MLDKIKLNMKTYIKYEQIVLTLILCIIPIFPEQWRYFTGLWLALSATSIFHRLVKTPIETFRNVAGEIMTNAENRVVAAVERSTLSIRDNVLNIADEAISYDSILKNFNRHKGGIGLCVSTAAQTTELIPIATEILKIGSFIGLETSLTKTIFGKMVARGPVVNQMGWQDAAPAAATLAAFAGYEIGEIDLSKTLVKSSNNLKAMTILIDGFSKLGEAMGIVKPKGFDELNSLSIQCLSLREEFELYTHWTKNDPNNFYRRVNQEKISVWNQKVKKINSELMKITDPKLKNTAIFGNIKTIVDKSLDLNVLIEEIKSAAGIRIETLGVNIRGPSQIGKTMFSMALIQKIKTSLAQHADLFPHAREYAVWSRNAADEFHSKYFGQEFVLCDDGWSLKSNIDQSALLSWLSSAPIGIIGASIEEKGRPFNSLCYITTCNQLPTGSITIENLSALHNRFPVHIEARMVGVKPRVFDPTFAHLQFRTCTMTEAVNGMTYEQMNPVTVDELVELIVEHMVLRTECYHSAVQTMRNQIVPEQVNQMMFQPLNELEFRCNNCGAVLELTEGIVRCGNCHQDNCSNCQEAHGLMYTCEAWFNVLQDLAIQEDQRHQEELERARRREARLRERVPQEFRFPPIPFPEPQQVNQNQRLPVVEEDEDPPITPPSGRSRSSSTSSSSIEFPFRPSGLPSRNSNAGQHDPQLNLVGQRLEDYITAKRQRDDRGDATPERRIETPTSSDESPPTTPVNNGERVGYGPQVPSTVIIGDVRTDRNLQRMLGPYDRRDREGRRLHEDDANIVDRLIAEQIRAAIASPIHAVSELGRWKELLVMRRNQMEFTTMARTGYYNRISVHEFIQTLGVYSIKQGMEKQFKEEFSKQQVVSFFDRYNTQYFWGPVINRGCDIVGLTNNLTAYVEDLPPSNLNAEERAELIQEIGGNPPLRNAVFEHMQRFFTNLATRRVVRTIYSISAFSLGVYADILPLQLIPYIIAPRIHFNVGPIQYRIGISPFTPIWEKITNFVENATGTMRGIILRTLEAFGIDISPLYNDLVERVGETMIDTGLTVLAAGLLYVIYKLVNSLTKKDEILLHNVSSDDDHRHRVSIKKQKQKPTSRIEAFHPKSSCGHIVVLDMCEICSNVKYKNKYTTILKKKLNYNDVPAIIPRATDIDVDNFEVVICEEGMMWREHEIDVRIQKPRRRVAVLPWSRGAKDIRVIHYEDSFVCETEDIDDKISESLTLMQKYKPAEYQIIMYIGYTEYQAHVDIMLLCYNSLIDDKVAVYTRKILADVPRYNDVINGFIINNTQTVESVMQKSCVDWITAIRSNHQVFVEKIMNNVGDVGHGYHQFGVASRDMVFLNQHTAKKDDLFRVWRQYDCTKPFYVGICVEESEGFDKSTLRLLKYDEIPAVCTRLNIKYTGGRVDKSNPQFSDLSSKLLEEEQWLKQMSKTSGFVILPKSNVVIPVILSYDGNREYYISTLGKNQRLSYINITEVDATPLIPVNGDCGGIICVNPPRGTPAVVGFFSGTGTRDWKGTVLCKPSPVNQLSFMDDTWRQLIAEGKPKDLPKGNEVKYIGTYIGKNTPISDTSLKKWHHSPFFDQFEEQLGPTPMDVNDPRIKVELPTNSAGKKSLLLPISSIIGETIPAMDKDLLHEIENTLSVYYGSKLQIVKTSNDIDEVLHNSINGDVNSIFDTGLKLNSSPGIPWTDFNVQSKNDLVIMDEKGDRDFAPDKGLIFRARLKKKILSANENKRTLSLVATKWKDAQIKKEYIEQGRGRVYQCVPIEKVCADKALFGNIKEAFIKSGMDCHHVIGINPHSIEWHQLARRLLKHPNYLDVDFRNYDRYLHGELMETAYNILINIIDHNAPDEWTQARKVLAQESIHTYLVDYNTIYKTNRGNKSGEFLTTMINCICNFILSYYCWLKLTGIHDLEVFLENVQTYSLGDDKVESVSDEYAQLYNYFKCKEVLEEIGHHITPGSKTDQESEFVDFDDLIFLKRKFKRLKSIYVAPLMLRSLEAPFVWTKVKHIEHDIWFELIKDKLYEASLHGEEYYNKFRKKLQKCRVNHLLKFIGPLLTMNYSDKIQTYLTEIIWKQNRINEFP